MGFEVGKEATVDAMRPGGPRVRRLLDSADGQGNHRGPMSTPNRFRLAAFLAFPLAGLFALLSLGNIVLPEAYARESASWTAQGLGQDWFDLVVVAPMLVVLAAGALRGSRPSTLLLGGVLAYSLYSMVLYAFAVHFNQLFLVYSVALGLAFYGLVSLVTALGSEDVRSWFSARAPVRTAGIFSALVGAAFYVLWLSEVIPALAAHAVPKSVVETGLITNPVQVLDISIVLPAFLAGGIALARRRTLGYWLVPVMLAFAVILDLALLAMTMSMAARKVAEAGPQVPIFALMAATVAALLWALLRSGSRRAES